jgi:thiol-disulfide isomerase/thioredoxin
MKIKWALLFLLAVVILGKYTYDQLVPPFKKGDVVPDFSLTDIDGNAFQLSSFKGQAVLVHFWATWCPQCVQELPLLDDFSRRAPDIKVLAVSEDEQGDDVPHFFGGARPNFTVLLDRDGRVADRYKSYKVPETFLLDRDGRFLHRFIGAVAWNGEDIGRRIGRYLAGASTKTQ